jgi:signal peptidase I
VTSKAGSRSLAALAVVLSVAGLALMVGLFYVLTSYKQFYMPAESMAPTLLKNDRLVAGLGAVEDMRRGDILLFRVGDSMYVKRLAGPPGDRVAMEGGVLILDGRPVPQQLVRTETVEDGYRSVEARRLRERFPGEASAHEIYDLGPTEVDDMPEQVVRPGHLFVLGDNRDRSADSRVSRASMGVEQLPLSDVRGRALFYSYGSSRPFRTSLRP